ncbi:MYB family transcription factor [Musa troglodytarum]|uniref:MYB family transcription factor n=1 Tax=Musa troglodytarum TaxID=320322 RepID=A0A9E7ERS8_9LILI|nr:MYB family transcription factor [Musa troglodytarum]
METREQQMHVDAKTPIPQTKEIDSSGEEQAPRVVRESGTNDSTVTLKAIEIPPLDRRENRYAVSPQIGQLIEQGDSCSKTT